MRHLLSREGAFVLLAIAIVPATATAVSTVGWPTWAGFPVIVVADLLVAACLFGWWTGSKR